MRHITALWLGRRRYGSVHALQHELHQARREGRIGDVALFLEHDPVITLGRGSHASHILAPRPSLEQAGIDVETTGRGGDVTLHAPGQLVCYPILDLNPDRRDVRRYVADLARVMQRLVADHGIDSGTVDGMVGLWVDLDHLTRWPGAADAAAMAKIGAIGVRMSRWITMHGFALNASIDLDLYRYIVPCGISTHPVTSLAAATGAAPTLRNMAEAARAHLSNVFACSVSALEDRSSAPLDLGILSTP